MLARWGDGDEGEAAVKADFDAEERENEWRNHIPSGYEDMTGYGQVSCSCGWDSSGKLGWEEHIDAEMAVNTARNWTSEPASEPSEAPNRA